jgi:pre-mRNA-splicing factor 18
VREQERKARGDVVGKDTEKEKEAKRRQEGPLDLGLVKTDFNKLHPAIYWAFKDLLKEWEAWLDARPGECR